MVTHVANYWQRRGGPVHCDIAECSIEFDIVLLQRHAHRPVEINQRLRGLISV